MYHSMNGYDTVEPRLGGWLDDLRAKLATAKATEALKTEQAEAAYYNTTTSAPVQTQQTVTEQPGQNNVTATGPSMSKPVIVIGGIILLAGIAGTIYYFKKRKQK